jgi:F0F1-type ATP synthase assembly protein I
MNDAKKMNDKSSWAIGGGVLLGLGVGFFFLKSSPLAFVGSILGGLGLGLIVTSIIATVNRNN